MKFILGTKENMTEYFSPEGEVFPVTIVSVGPVTVTKVFEKVKDGYNAVQVGFGVQKESRITKGRAGNERCLLQRVKRIQIKTYRYE